MKIPFNPVFFPFFFFKIGLAFFVITEAIVNDENVILLISIFVYGFFLIKVVYLSLPAIINKRGIKQVFYIKHNSQEEAILRNSANVLKKTIQ